MISCVDTTRNRVLPLMPEVSEVTLYKLSACFLNGLIAREGIENGTGKPFPCWLENGTLLSNPFLLFLYFYFANLITEEPDTEKPFVRTMNFNKHMYMTTHNVAKLKMKIE